MAWPVYPVCFLGAKQEAPSVVDYLVIAGGGGGGFRAAGGGGAGGYREALSFPVTAGSSYTITVGGGGASGTNGVCQ